MLRYRALCKETLVAKKCYTAVCNVNNNRSGMSGKRSWRNETSPAATLAVVDLAAPALSTPRARTIVENLPKRVPCQVGSETGRPCPRLAVVEVRGLPFCERCAREQEAYFAIGELTQGEEETRGLRDEPLVEALGRMRRERTGYAAVAEMEKVSIGDPE
jgi:hypothetical protein